MSPVLSPPAGHRRAALPSRSGDAFRVGTTWHGLATRVLWPLLGIFACSGAASSDDAGSPFEDRGPTGDLAQFEAALTGPALRALRPTWSEPTDLRLPKLTIRPAPGGSLKEAMKSLGMQRAFDNGAAQLGGIVSNWPVFLDQLVQKTYFAIDEEGLEAAAITVAVGADGGISLPPTSPRVVSADKPFLLVVGDPSTQAILFSGHLVDPTL